MGLRNEIAARSDDPAVASAALLTQSWRRCCERLRAELGEDIFNSWFGRIELESVGGGQARLSVPTRFLKSWIDTHYLGHITVALAAEFGPIARILVVVRSSVRPETQAGAAICALPVVAKTRGRRARGSHGAGAAAPSRHPGRNPRRRPSTRWSVRRSTAG